MHYISTRGQAPRTDFLSASLGGLAPDGGLYVPESWPQLPIIEGESYVALATRILTAFAGDSVPPDVMERLVTRAYARFYHARIAPLTQLGASLWQMELHHGQTLAFKDVAMSFIGQLYDWALTERGERMTVVCATSGDTGGAAAAAFAGLDTVDLFILHPAGRISPVQRRFMTATGASNIHNLAIEGDFDQAQALVKALFGDADFRNTHRLSGVNSINWARIAAQSVYFAAAQAALGRNRKLRFVVPTGNFGDALAGYVAARMGLLNGLEILTAVNANDAMVQLLDHGMLTRASTKPTLSPAMDIQVPSNVERLIFEASGRDPAAIRALYGALAQAGSARLPDTLRGPLGCMGLSAIAVDDGATTAMIARAYAQTGWFVCPHTAVGLVGSERPTEAEASVVLATAHAAKFPETVTAAVGLAPPVPAHAEPFLKGEEVFDTVPGEIAAVRAYIAGRTRAR